MNTIIKNKKYKNKMINKKKLEKYRAVNEKYVPAIATGRSKSPRDAELEEKAKKYKAFNTYVEEAVNWFKEIQDRRFKQEGLSPIEKAVIMQYETMASQYITDQYKMFNLVTKTKNYHETQKKIKKTQIKEKTK